jgi:hypothetical protein
VITSFIIQLGLAMVSTDSFRRRPSHRSGPVSEILWALRNEFSSKYLIAECNPNDGTSVAERAGKVPLKIKCL